MRSPILYIDILHCVRQHLPFVDRRELSLVCKMFQEDLGRVFKEYMDKGLKIMKVDVEKLDGVFIAGEFMTWTTMILTSRETPARPHDTIDAYVKDDDYRIVKIGGVYLHKMIPHPLKYLDVIVDADIRRVAYEVGANRLYVKNWKDLQARKTESRIDPAFYVSCTITPYTGKVSRRALDQYGRNRRWCDLCNGITTTLCDNEKAYARLDAWIDHPTVQKIIRTGYMCDYDVLQITGYMVERGYNGKDL